MEKHYNHLSAQKEAHDLWHREKTYSTHSNPGPLYSIDTPPPTVSGNLHIGHIFSYTQTDILARYARMNGYSVFYPFGFDDNGLPTERYVEKKLDISAHTLSRSEFIKVCLLETHAVEEQFKALWQQMGLSVDWSHCYSTISDSTRAISQESFLRLLQKGYAYRKNEPALYCTTCRTSVAQAELDDAQKPSLFNDIIFTSQDGLPLVISTTRPELLPSVNALLYHPDDSRYTTLAGSYAIVPLFGQKIPILADDTVLIEKGTGLVMTSTFGDKTDIEWFKKHQLEYRPSIGLDGKFLASTGILAGLYTNQARAKVLEELKNAGLLQAQKSITHTVNVHERCKREIEYVMIPQWFLNVKDYKKELIAQADMIEWYPAHMKSRYIHWVENLAWDWCLSRQRFFGIPFPVWHCANGHIIQASLDTLPVDPQETNYTGPCPECGSSQIHPDTDVMDTWNTSSLTPFICKKLYDPAAAIFDANAHTAAHEPFFPMSMRPQAHDIIRTWAFYTIVKSWMHTGKIPWNSIVISGHVLAETKEKLSKSKDNASTSPQGLLERYPADVIRYWTASGGLGHDIAFSETQLKIGHRLVTKLWNAFRFIYEHVSATPDKQPQTPLGITNEWILDAATHTFSRYQTYFEQNEFGLALDVAEKFFWHSFCDNYLELIKDQLFNPDRYTEFEVAATRWTLSHIGLRILQLYAPYLPYLTETLYGIQYKKMSPISSVHQTKFKEAQRLYEFKDSARVMEKIIELITTVRKLKTEKQLSLKVPLASLMIHCEHTDLLHAIERETLLIKGITHAETIHFAQTAQPSAITEHNSAWSATVHVSNA